MTTKKMYGLKINKDAIATKGVTRRESKWLFSVKGTVAFPDYKATSPDCTSGARGYDLLTKDYFLQEDINLEEYDNTRVDQYGKGQYDIGVVVELENLWRIHRWSFTSSSDDDWYYLMDVRESKDVVMDDKFFISSRIEKIRNHDLWLHVYEVKASTYNRASECKGFDEAIEAIIKDSPIARAEYGMQYWQEGVPFPIAWRKTPDGTSMFAGGDGSCPEILYYHEGGGGWLSVSPEIPEGRYFIEVFGIPGYLYLKHGHEPYLSACWDHEVISTKLKEGMVFFHGNDKVVDVYEKTQQRINLNVSITRQIQSEKRIKRMEAFEAAKAGALEAGLSKKEAKRVIDLSPKGKVISTLELAGFMRSVLRDGDWTVEMVQKYLDINRDRAAKHESYLRAAVLSPAAMKGFVWLVGKYEYDDNFQFNWKAIKRAIDRAYAWEYLNDTLPGYEIAFGDFDDFIDSLKLFYDEYHE